MNTVELDAVCKSYDSRVAVDKLSLCISKGEIYGLLGPNGAGKTTTIRMMIDIAAPDAGQVRLFGEPFRRSHLLRVGYLPEERGLYKKMKVREQLVFFAELHGVSASEAARRAAFWCERLRLVDRLESKTEELSKGLQQKLQFLAALLHDPDFIIMDEPFSGLDPVNTKELKEVLLELSHAGKTILFSTHQMEQVERMCDSICLIDHGRAVLQGGLKQVKAQFGSNSVQIEHDGPLDFLAGNPLVQSFNDSGNHVEIRLAPGADPQQLLRAVAERSRVSKFELMEPSLEDIFIEVVGKSDA